MKKPPHARELHELDGLRRGLVSHNILIGQRRTSFRLDDFTWRALHEIAQREGVTVHQFCAAINSEKLRALTLTAAVRLAVLRYYHDAATEPGHAKAGHGALHAPGADFAIKVFHRPLKTLSEARLTKSRGQPELGV